MTWKMCINFIFCFCILYSYRRFATTTTTNEQNWKTKIARQAEFLNIYVAICCVIEIMIFFCVNNSCAIRIEGSGDVQKRHNGESIGCKRWE